MSKSKEKSYLNSFEFDSQYFLKQLEAARDESYSYFSHNQELNQKVQKIYWFQDVIIEIPACDFDSIKKHQQLFPLPYKEAQIRLKESVNLAICGLYKSAYDSLRNHLELIFLGLLQSTSLQSPEKVEAWLNSEEDTPAFSKIINQLFDQTYFSEANQAFHFKDLLQKHYWYLCDYVHTKGGNHSYTALNLSNFPRFIQKSLELYVTDCLLTCELSAIGLALKYPICLEPLPLTQKMGLNLPAGGFLELFEVKCLKDVIDDKRLRDIKDIVKNDENVSAIKDWIFSMPDLTEEEWQLQIEEDEKWKDEMRKKGLLVD